MADESRIRKFNKRKEALKNERSNYMDYWGELADNILFHRGRFLTKKKGPPKRNTKQYNNTPRMASRTLASGMMAGITSPARPWFKLAASDPDLNESANVRAWLHRVEVLMYRVFSASNFYNALSGVYAELGTFGTAAMGMYEDFDNVIHCKTYTVGSYMLGLGDNDRVDTFYREYCRTVGQLVKQFGIENVSQSVKQQWERGSTEAEIDIVHVVEPNDDRNMMSPLARDKAYRSVYYEKSQVNAAEDKFLRESGFDTFPILAPRWDVVGEETYAEDCPGMLAIGDSKALQLGERRKYQALDVLANPPLQGPSGAKSQFSGNRPAPGSFTANENPAQRIESIYGNYQPRLDYVQAIQAEVEQRINEAFHVDLFLMLHNSDRRQITAREVAEKHEEKLLMLGPVLERLHSELLDPAIDRVFSILQQSGVLPPPPPELVDTEMTVEYVSVLAQAQRMVGISALERTIGFVAEMSNIWPEARHKINAQNAVDEYSNSAGVNPNVVRPDDEATQLTQAEQQAAQQAAQQEAMAQGTQNMKNLSQAETNGENALADMLRNAGLQ